MIIISGNEKFHIEEKTAVAIGKFDGIHLGHRVLLRRILEASKNNLKTAVFTFDPPVEELFGNGEFRYLLTKDEKREMFHKLGIDYLIEFPMNARTAAISPEQFVKDYIANSINASLVVCGDDLSFGDKGRGDYKLLEKMAKEFSFETESINKISIDGNIVSSSLIREYVSNGEMKKAREFLGDNYYISGTVIHGKALGRSFGVPTINLDFADKKIIPPFGVYYSQVYIDDKMYKSITNIGTKPTIKDDLAVNAETFIYDFDGNLYDSNVKVSLLEYKRPEMKFKNLDELKKQILEDIEAGRAY